ncbi:MAG: hypothetical protein R3F49_06630 [Planctomycetota bacterium]
MRLHIITSTLLAFHLSALALAATAAGPLQDGPAPPAEALSALAPLVGAWDGVGVVRMSATDQAGLAWSATIDAEWILGGHALREVTHVSFGDSLPPISMESLYTFDPNTQRLAQCTVTAGSGMEVADLVHSPRPGVIVTLSKVLQDGHLTVMRSSMAFDGDSFRYVSHSATDEAAAFEHINGSFQRRAATKHADHSRADHSHAAAASAPVERPGAPTLSDALAPLAPMLGVWDIAGSWTAGPDMPSIKIVAIDTIAPILDGSAMTIETRGGQEGQPFDYEAYLVAGWDEAAGAFRQVWSDNLGLAGTSLLYRLADGNFVAMRNGAEGGVPYSESTTLAVVDGKLSSVQTTRATGTLAPQALFQGRYSARGTASNR